jgi:hypothetical protein
LDAIAEAGPPLLGVKDDPHGHFGAAITYVDPDAELPTAKEKRRVLAVRQVSPALQASIRKQVRDWFGTQGLVPLDGAPESGEWRGIFFLGYSDLLLPYHLHAIAEAEDAPCADFAFDLILIGGGRMDPETSQNRKTPVIIELLKYADKTPSSALRPVTTFRVEAITFETDEGDAGLERVVEQVSHLKGSSSSPANVKVVRVTKKPLWTSDSDGKTSGDFVVQFIDAAAAETRLLRRSKGWSLSAGTTLPWRYEVHAPLGQWHLWLEMILIGLRGQSE